MNIKKLILVFFVYFILLTGCSPRTTKALTQCPGNSQQNCIEGKISKYTKTNKNFVHFAPYFANDAQNGMFMYQDGYHLKSEIASDGSFIVVGLPIGEYVLIVGADSQSSIFLKNAELNTTFILKVSDASKSFAIEEELNLP